MYETNFGLEIVIGQSEKIPFKTKRKLYIKR